MTGPYHRRYQFESGHGARVDHPDFPHTKAVTSPTAEALAEVSTHLHQLQRLVRSLGLLGTLLEGEAVLPDGVDPSPVIDTLWTGAVMEYTRCFHGGKHSLDAKVIFASEPERLATHQQFWFLRSKHFAHDVNDYRRVQVGVWLDAEGNLKDTMRTISAATFGMTAFLELFNLVVIAASYAEEERKRLVASMVAEVLSMSAEERLALPEYWVEPPAISDIERSRRGAK